MNFLRTHLASETLTVLALAVHFAWRRKHSWLRSRWGNLLWTALVTLVVAACVLEVQRISRLFPPYLFRSMHSVALGWSLASLLLWSAQTLDRWLLRMFGRSRPHASDRLESPERRDLILQAARAAVYAAPAAAFGYGTFIERDNFQVQEITIPVAGLPKELEGLQIVQITDIHMGAFLSSRSVARIVGMANDTRSHLAIMTGDLVTGTGDPLDLCLAHLSSVKAEAGMIGCLGNHEIYAGAEDYVQREGARLGIRFLRHENLVMEFRGHRLNFTGVDYQRKGEPYLVGAERLIQPGMPNILLSHSPDVFPVAVRQGYDLTLSGHTHGGQITVEYLQQFVNPARFVTRYVSGLYTEADKNIYVSRGLGTVGVPTRLCAPPELTVIRLASGSKAAV